MNEKQRRNYVIETKTDARAERCDGRGLPPEKPPKYSAKFVRTGGPVPVGWERVQRPERGRVKGEGKWPRLTQG
jgi:hypothetical protein